MAAGVIYQTVTTTTGETVELGFYVDNTGTPTTWKPINAIVDGSGNVIGSTSNALDVNIKSLSGANANGYAVAASSAPVVAASAGFSASATFTPAAAAHGAGDCVGAAAEIDFNAPSGTRLMITSATFELDNTAAVATAWRLHLYNVTPPGAAADNDLWDLPSGDRTAYLGYVDIPTMPADLGSTQWQETHGINKQIKLSGDSVFAYLTCVSGITTTASAHIVTLHAVLV